jgi:hypothetical protein
MGCPVHPSRRVVTIEFALASTPANFSRRYETKEELAATLSVG